VQVQPGQVQLSPFGAPPTAPAKTLSPDQVVAVVNGTELRVADVRKMLAGAPPSARQSAAMRPQDFLQWTLMMEKLSRESDEIGLSKKSPYADRLAWSRMQILMAAMLDRKSQEIVISEDDVQSYYQKHPVEFGTAKVKLLYLSAEESNDAQVKAKAESLVKQARAGADFVKLVKQYSEDPGSAAKNGDFGEVNAQSKLPEPVKNEIFGTKTGAVTNPIRQEGGYYIFQVLSIDAKPLAEARPGIREKLKRDRTENWMNAIRDQISVKIVDEGYFREVQAAAGPFPEQVQLTLEGGRVKPEEALMEVNGKPFTLQQYYDLFQLLPPKARGNAVSFPEAFLQQYQIMRELEKLAEQDGLDKRQPFAGRINHDRLQILTQARTDEYMNLIQVEEEELKKAYESKQDKLRFAEAQVLYISYSPTPPPRTDPNAPKILSEAEARAKAEDLWKQIKSGAGIWENMVAQHSEDEESKVDDGLMPPMEMTDEKVPEPIRKAVFATPAGQLTEPVLMPNGYYIFRVLKNTQKSYEETKDALREEIRQARFQDWLEKNRKSFQVEIRDEAAFKQMATE